MHLHEIGCRAFSLITTNNPKILHRSIPCVLIGYAPNAKAYRLWDPTTDRIFNSFHVSFIEARHLPPPSPPPVLTPLPSNVNQHTSPASLSPPSIETRHSPTSLPHIPLSHQHPLPISHPPPSINTHQPPSSLPPIPPSSQDPFPVTRPPHSNISYPIRLPCSNNIQPSSTTTPPPTSTPAPPAVPFSHSTSHKNNNIPFYYNNNNISRISAPVSNNQPLRNTVSLNHPALPHNDTVPHESTVLEQNTILQEENTALQQDNNVLQQVTQTPISPPNTNLPLDVIVTPPIPPVPPNIPTPAPSFPTPSRLPIPSSRTLPRRSARLAALQSSSSSPTDAHTAMDDNEAHDYTAAFLSEFSPLRDSHYLLPLTLDPSFVSSSSSLGDALTALATGSTELTLDSDDDPLWATAIASSEREYWIAGARDELRSLKDLNVFVLVPRSELPRGQRPLKGKLVCKRKRDDAGNITRYKVRYVAKGFAQRYLIDYEKTTAPTARLESFRALMHIAACLDWDIQHFDIKTAFLHGVLPETETVFMEQPPGFEEPGKSDWIWRLSKSLYGMKQASRIWNQTFHKTMISIGFKRLVNEWCVYRRQRTSGITIFAVHVDDIISISSSQSENDSFKAELQSHWDISDLGAVKFALGIAISRDRSSRTIHLSQTALIDRIVDQFGQTDSHPVSTPMVPGLIIRRPDPTLPITGNISSWMARTPYRSLVGSLMYLAVGTRPDIAFAVGRLATVFDCYRPEHWDAAVRVVRYLKGSRTSYLELGGSNPIQPIAFTDSDYANCPDTSRSIGGYCFSLGSGLVSWASHKQKHTADSSCYAEYIAIHDATHELLFLRQFLDGLDMPLNNPTPLYCDNDAARQLTEDQRQHSKLKHIRVHYHSTRDLVDLDELKVLRVRSSENIADILTKALCPNDFARLRGYMGIRHARVA